MKTADLVDAYNDRSSSATCHFRKFGRKRAFFGPIATIKTFEDNALLIRSPGTGA